MSKNSNVSINLNKFLNNISLKKQYIKNLQTQTLLLNTIKQKNYKLLNSSLLKKQSISANQDHVIMYIIDITFLRSNTLLHVMDISGKLKFFCSAGYLKHKGKSKKARFSVFKGIYRLLVTKLRFLKGKPLALHLKNVGFNKFWMIKKLKTKFFIKTVKIFNSFPHNGCRKKKVRRKKFKKKRRNG
jgi:ribosomal protein S11